MRRTNVKYISRIIVLPFLLVFSLNLYSQKKYELSGGLGWPGLISLNCRYGSDLQLGIGAGFMHMNNTYASTTAKITYWNFSADLYDHFAGSSKYSEQLPWYINIGTALSPIRTFEIVSSSETHTSTNTYISLYSRIGRTINLSDKCGFTADIGIFQAIAFQSGEKKIPIIILPAFSTGFFIRL